MISIYFQTSREDFFYFLFCSLCHSVISLLHSHGHIFLSSMSFVMQFVRACSCPLPESSSKICTLAVHSFITFQTKGSCFSLVKAFHRPICLSNDLPHRLFACFKFYKLLLHTPPLSLLETGYLAPWRRHTVTSQM